jgi:hypothetical protein
VSYRWLFVRIAEIDDLAELSVTKFRILYASINRFSARFSNHLHKRRVCAHP